MFSVVKQLQNVGRSYDGLSVSAKGAGPSCGVVLTVLLFCFDVGHVGHLGSNDRFSATRGE